MTIPRALSREAIRAMPLDEFERRQAEINRWVAAGAKDGEPAPNLERPEGHTFTRVEIKAMSQPEFEANESAITAQMRNGGIS